MYPSRPQTCSAAEDGLELFFYLQRAGVTGVCHHAYQIQSSGRDPGSCTCQAITLPTLHMPPSPHSILLVMIHLFLDFGSSLSRFSSISTLNFRLHCEII